MNRHFTCGILATVLLFCVPCQLGAACVEVTLKPEDDAAVTAKKTEYAIAVISDSNNVATEKYCVTRAIWYLGNVRATKAIPNLVALLSVDLVPASPAGANFEGNYFKRYPAIGALSNMGEAAVPALLTVIAQSDPSSVKTKNAIYSLMGIQTYRSNPGKALKFVTKAADEQQDPHDADRLRKAGDEIRASYCMRQACNE